MSHEQPQDIDSIDIDDDFSESWDELIDDEYDEGALSELSDFGSVTPDDIFSSAQPAPNRKNRKALSVIIVTFALSGGAYFLSTTMHYDSAQQHIDHIPIVTIDQPDIKVTSEESIAPISASKATAQGLSNKSVIEPQISNGMGEPTQDISVLTPLPEISTLDAAPLPILESSPSPTVTNHHANTNQDNLTTEALTEEEFLSKTDINFKSESEDYREALKVPDTLSQSTQKDSVEPHGKTVENSEPEVNSVIDPLEIKDNPMTDLNEIESASDTPKIPIEELASKVRPPETRKDTTSVKKAPIAKPAPLWIIKGAQPGRAILYDKRARETKAIEIGDTVAGIGRVQSIKNINGKWRITGKNGIINQ
ncbi:MAG: hypothetical protein ACRBCK_01625 [Alphaproteobacteria bacterium]